MKRGTASSQCIASSVNGPLVSLNWPVFYHLAYCIFAVLLLKYKMCFVYNEDGAEIWLAVGLPILTASFGIGVIFTIPSPPGGVRSIVMSMFVCLFVRLFAGITRKPHR